MNVTEIRKLVSDSEHKAWYKSLSVKLEFPFSSPDDDINLEGLDTIYSFFQKQRDYYENNEPLPEILKPSKRHFNHCIEKIEEFVNKNLITRRSNKDNDWSILKSECQNIGNNNESYFNKESSTTDFLLKLDSEYMGASRGAYDFFTNQHFKYNNSDKNYFIGWQKAYEFFIQDADLVKRRNNERITLNKIRSEYIQNLEKNDQSVSEHIAEKERKYEEKENIISRLIKVKNTQYEKWKSNSQIDFEKFLKDSDIAIKDLEDLYQKKLKLEAPAKYWQERANKLRKEGNRWLAGFIISISISIISLGVVLYLISNGSLKEFFGQIDSAIRWSIIFITFISFLAYAIRIFAKLTFSSYHLVRDAEEREQLAYVYLALVKEKNIDETERHLVMQSLFSRADSGLLKDDSSPTMPGGSIIEKIMGSGK